MDVLLEVAFKGGGKKKEQKLGLVGTREGPFLKNTFNCLLIGRRPFATNYLLLTTYSLSLYYCRMMLADRVLIKSLFSGVMPGRCTCPGQLKRKS